MGIIFISNTFRSIYFGEVLVNSLLAISVLVPSIWWLYCAQKDKKTLAVYEESLVRHQQLVEMLRDTEPGIVRQMGDLPPPKPKNRRWPIIGTASVALFTIATLIGPVYADTASTAPSQNVSAGQGVKEESSVDTSPQFDDSITFIDGIYKSPKVTIQINDVRKIAIGEEGNKYGDRPVIAFWYDTTGITDERITPLEWISIFDVIQDNDPNMVNKLDVASHPDMGLLKNQSAVIKPGGTVTNAVAYYLDDEMTPVELVVSDFLGGLEYGRKAYSLP